MHYSKIYTAPIQDVLFLKVLLINPQLPPTNRISSWPLGLLSIASFLKSKGHTVKLVDQTVKMENIEKHIKSFNPDVVGITIVSPLASKAAVNASKIAKKYNKYVVWGGVIISAIPELGFKEGCVDFIVMGEGEITFCELLDTIEKGGPYDEVAGLTYMDSSGVHFNKNREFADLSTFPTIDFSLVDPKKYFQRFFLSKKMLYLYSSKGCPAKCTFCFNAQYNRSIYRPRPPEHVVDEIEYLIKHCGMDGVSFCDEFFYPKKEDMRKMFCLFRERKLDFVWGCQTRLGVFTQEDFQQMYDAGCRWILFGIESGCKERNIKTKKRIDLDQAKDTFEICREIGITTQSAFIIGYPDETVEELKETIHLALDLNANLCPVSILSFLPGSEMFDDVVNKGLYIPPKSLREWSKITVGDDVVANLTEIPDKDLLVIHYYFQWLGFSKKDAVNDDSYGIVKKMAADAFKKIFNYGIITLLPGLFASAKQFITVIWYAKAYPNVLKKYGLYGHRQK